jgi:type IV pilus assembly protein PilB
MTAEEARGLERSELAGRSIFEPKGCIYCGGRGFVGRVGLFEMLSLSEEWSRRVAEGAEEAELTSRMREQSVPTLVDDGVAKLLAGTTSLREVLGAACVW